MTTFLCWWHRKVLGHYQESVINGPTEPGVKCYRGAEPKPHRWFPSDGGHGR